MKQNRIIKRILSLVVATLLFVGTVIFDIPLKTYAAENNRVRVIIENSTYAEEEGAPWDGILVDEWVSIDENSTLINCILTALGNHNYTQTGAEDGYITEINGLSAFDGGDMSGWMVSLNDWFTDEVISAYTVEAGKLESGDLIRVMYTRAWGADIGSNWDNNDTKLNGVIFDRGTVSPEFGMAGYDENNVADYFLLLPEGTEAVNITPTAVNKNFMVKTTVDETEYKRTESVPVSEGTVITVECGNPSWPSMNTSEKSHIYRFTVKYQEKLELASLKVSTASTSTAANLISFDKDTTQYNISGIDDSTSLYFKAGFDTELATVRIIYGSANTEAELKNNRTKSLTNSAGNGTYTIKVIPKDTTNYSGTEYVINTATVPVLTALSINVDGIPAPLNPAFNKTNYSYTVNASENADTAVINVTKKSASANITYNGSSDNTVALNGVDKIDVVVEGDTEGILTNTYTINIEKCREYGASFNVTPGDAVIKVFDPNGNQITPDEDGKYYGIFADGTYTYEVCFYGYRGVTGTIPPNGGNIDVTLDSETGSSYEEVSAEWPNFRNGTDNMAITDVILPTSPEEVSLNWAVKLGTGWSAAPSVQIIVDNSLVVMSGTQIYKLDIETGEVLAKSDMIASPNFGYIPPTYGGGLIYCPLSNGTIQAFKADTLESVWVYKDALKGQSLSPIVYDSGYIYTGFWNGEAKDANYVCISVCDDDPQNSMETKLPVWTKKQAGGFYWAGGCTVGDVIIVGTDDGASGTSGSGNIFSINKKTGEVISGYTVVGDQRSSIAYDRDSGRIYFTTKSGYLYSAKLDSATGVLSDLKGVNYNAQTTSTPVVYKGRVYFATGSGISSSGSKGNVVMADAYTLEMLDYVPLQGYPQCSLLLTTAFEESENAIYLYSTYNNKPGGITMIKVDLDKEAGAMQATELYDAKGYENFCITSLICDSKGNIYYKNDSTNIFSVGFVSVSKTEYAISRLETVTLDSEKDIRIARNLYDKLTEEERARVSNADLLAEAESCYARLVAVRDAIMSIGVVSAESWDKLMYARALYETLSEKEKARITNYEVLVAAETEYKRLTDTKTEDEEKYETEDKETGKKEEAVDKTENVKEPVDKAENKAEKTEEKTEEKAAEKTEPEATKTKETENPEEEKHLIITKNKPTSEYLAYLEKLAEKDGIVRNENLLGVFEISVDGVEHATFDDEITVSIPVSEIPDYEKYDGFIVMHIKENNDVEYIEATIVDDALCFGTISFSEFVVYGYIGDSPLHNVVTEKTGSDSGKILFWILIMAGAMIVLAGAVIFIKRSKSE